MTRHRFRFRSAIMAAALFLLAGCGLGELYLIDAHSQIDEDVIPETVVALMERHDVRQTILSTRGDRDPSSVFAFLAGYGGSIVPAVTVKGDAYYEDNYSPFSLMLRGQLITCVGSLRITCFAMAEVLSYHAAKDERAGLLEVALDDPRVLLAVRTAIQQGWPSVIHIEFAALKTDEGAQRASEYWNALEDLLDSHPTHPFALILLKSSWRSSDEE